jgi:gliding motility-associated-like protein
VRIIASQNNTVVNLTGGMLISGSLNLDAGEWAEIEVYASQNGCYIEANQPVGVASYLTGSQYPGLSYSRGAPAMVWIPPVEQSVKEALIAPSWGIYGFPYSLREDFVLIVVPTSAKNLTEMKQDNGAYTALTGGAWHDHPSGYSYYTLSLDDPEVRYGFKNPEGLIVLAYGLGSQESYYYIAASATLKLDVYFEVNGIHCQSLEGKAFCDDDIEVKATVKHPLDNASGSLRWLVDGAEQAAFTDSLHWKGNLPAGEHTILMIARNQYGILLDSLTASFIIAEKKETVIDSAICQNDSYFFKGEYLNAPGIYRDTLSTVYGCDSIIVLNLAVNPADTLRLPETTIYAGEGYYENGFNISPPYSTGMQSDTLFLQNRFHCDSMVVLNLEIICRENETFLNISTCQNEPYFFKGEYLNVQGVYRDTLPAMYGCDSIIILDLTVYPADTLRLPATIIYAGEGYYENGFHIPPQYPGVRSDTLRWKNRFDCDSTVILDLRVICPPPAETTLNGIICQGESYSGYGFTLTPHDVPGSYTYRQELTGMYGCDSTVTLHLTVKPAHEAAFFARISVNEPYSANGFSIPSQPEPGFFPFERRLKDRFGCDSTTTLYLTVYAEIIPDKYFSPNGDGMNDAWNIKNIEYFEVISVDIYDRFGKLLVRNVGNFIPWDGTYRGKAMPSDDYWYVITLNEEVKQRVGHFTLLR